MVFSPLGLVPKKEAGKFRIIHDLSYPKGYSVNESIPHELATVSYLGLDHCVSLILTIGKGALIAKADLKDVFRIVPISHDHHLLGFTWEGQYYYDKRLPMGCRLSCALFEELSTALHWIMENKYCVTHISHIPDDFVFCGPPASDDALKALLHFQSLTDYLQNPLKQDKTVFPTTCAILHGIEVDTTTLQLRLPQDKLITALDKVNDMCKCKKVQLRNLQSLLGLLSFCCKALCPEGHS